MIQTPTVKPQFIPKKEPVERRTRGGTENIFMIASIVVLVVSLGAWGGFMYYRFTLLDDKEVKETTLEEITDEKIDLELIAELEELDKKLNIANDLLRKHTDLTLVFSFLRDHTLTSGVRFTLLEYNRVPNGGIVKLGGVARDFSSLAYQRQVLRESGMVSNPALSDFAVSPETSNVLFTLTFGAHPDILRYGSRFMAEEAVLESADGAAGGSNQQNGI